MTVRVLVFDASDRGGIATYTDRMVAALAAAGVDVRLCAPRGRARGAPVLRPQAWGDDVAEVTRLGLYRRRAVEAVLGAATFLRAVRSVRPDVVHLQTRVAPRLDPLLLRLLHVVRPRVGVVVTVHDAEPLDGDSSSFARQARVLCRADAVIVHGERVRDSIAHAAAGVPVTAVPADFTFVDHPMEQARARVVVGIEEGARVALLFGLLRAYKGLDLLAAAWPDVRRELPEATLYVVGSSGGFDVPALGLLEAMEGEGVVVRDRFVPEEEVDAWLAATDVLVLPYTTGVHSGVLARAVAHGTPVIASPVLAEEVAARAAGRVVPLEATAWAEALTGALGADPIPAPVAIGGGRLVAETVACYEAVVARRAGH